MGGFFFIYILTAFDIAVYAIADDSPISDETGPVAEGVCSIGILMCVRCVKSL